jgi:hypothetical protein
MALSFSSSTRFSNSGPTTISRSAAARLRIESQTNRDSYGGMAYERNAALRVAQTLVLLKIDTDSSTALQEEAEMLGDILNLNPGMLAAAMYYYLNSPREFNAAKFRKIAREIIPFLLNENVFVPTTNRAKESAPIEDYIFDFLRYVLYLGHQRGYKNIPVL